MLSREFKQFVRLQWRARTMKPRFRFGDRRFLFMHVGKTGGTSVMNAIAAAHEDGARVPMVLSHKWTMPMARIRYPSARLAVVLRDPVERIVSGFNDRLRQNTAERPIVWTDEEAIAFSFFASSDEFLDAALSGNARSRSAVRYAMQAVRHLRRGYVHHFVSPEYVAANAERFYCIGDIGRLDSFFSAMMQPLNPGAAGHSQYLARHNTAAEGGRKPSGRGEDETARLRAFFAAEYAIYDALRRLADTAEPDRQSDVATGS